LPATPVIFGHLLRGRSPRTFPPVYYYLKRKTKIANDIKLSVVFRLRFRNGTNKFFSFKNIGSQWRECSRGGMPGGNVLYTLHTGTRCETVVEDTEQLDHRVDGPYTV